MEKLIIASNNKGKIAEIKSLLKGKFEIISMAEAGINIKIIENGKTFYDNALIKAKAVSAAANAPALADDSGLCVYALNNAPGVYSARYAGENATDNDNNLKLLKEMKNIKDRRAEFVCCAVIYYPQCSQHPSGKILSAEGRIKGKILHDFKGSGGFGYDSLFYCYKLKKSFGEAGEEEKNRISHRFQAVSQLEKLQITNYKL